MTQTTQTSAEAQETLLAHDRETERWSETLAQLIEATTRHDREAASAALAGAAPAKLAAQGARLREELRVAEGAVSLLAERRDELVYRLRLAEYGEIRERHAALVAQIGAIWERLEAIWAEADLLALTGASARQACSGRMPRLLALETDADLLARSINRRRDDLREEDQRDLI